MSAKAMAKNIGIGFCVAHTALTLAFLSYEATVLSYFVWKERRYGKGN